MSRETVYLAKSEQDAHEQWNKKEQKRREMLPQVRQIESAVNSAVSIHSLQLAKAHQKHQQSTIYQISAIRAQRSQIKAIQSQVKPHKNLVISRQQMEAQKEALVAEASRQLQDEYMRQKQLIEAERRREEEAIEEQDEVLKVLRMSLHPSAHIQRIEAEIEEKRQIELARQKQRILAKLEDKRREEVEKQLQERQKERKEEEVREKKERERDIRAKEAEQNRKKEELEKKMRDNNKRRKNELNKIEERYREKAQQLRMQRGLKVEQLSRQDLELLRRQRQEKQNRMMKIGGGHQQDSGIPNYDKNIVKEENSRPKQTNTCCCLLM